MRVLLHWLLDVVFPLFNGQSGPAEARFSHFKTSALHRCPLNYGNVALKRLNGIASGPSRQKVSRKLPARPFCGQLLRRRRGLEARKHESWRGETGKSRLIPVKERVRRRTGKGGEDLAQRVYL